MSRQGLQQSWTHFIGIGGAGMSGLAKVLLEMGEKVSGSDLVPSDLTRNLENLGAEIFKGHAPSHLQEGVDRVVISSAIDQSNTELQKAASLGIPVCLRIELLAELMKSQKGIAIAGSHGKTTTSSMIGWCLENNGWDPSIVIGGEVSNLGENAKLGSGEYIVAEADESDGSFLKLNPHIGVITNIENDHLDYYQNLDNLIEAFEKFIGNVSDKGFTIICTDSPITKKLSEKHTKVITYGFNPDADYRATDLELTSTYSKATIYYKGTYLGNLKLIVPGEYNISNALGALALCLELGLSFGKTVDALALFRGVKRRFQHIGTVDEIMVIDDYAHHPTEIRAALGAAEQLKRDRIWAVFQPHRYSRTEDLYIDFAKSLTGKEKVIISDIYGAGEEPIDGITSKLIVDTIEKEGGDAIYLPSQEEIIAYLKKHLLPGDMVITLGAGDIWQLGRKLLTKLSEGA